MISVGKDEREHLVIAPFFRTETPPLGAACLVAYLKKFNIELNVSDYRLRSNINVLPRDNVTFSHNYAGELQDLPLILFLAENFLKKRPLLEGLDKVLKDYTDTRLLSPYVLEEEIEHCYKMFEEDISFLCQHELIGFTTYATNMFATVLCVCLLKRAKPDITIVLGGPQVTESQLTSELVLRLGIADVIALSDGEEVFRQIIEANRKNENLSVPGTITFDMKEKKLLKKMAPPLNLSDLPCPDFSNLALEKYSHSPSVLPLYASRGCPFKCEF